MAKVIVSAVQSLEVVASKVLEVWDFQSVTRMVYNGIHIIVNVH